MYNIYVENNLRRHSHTVVDIFLWKCASHRVAITPPRNNGSKRWSTRRQVALLSPPPPPTIRAISTFRKTRRVHRT